MTTSRHVQQKVWPGIVGRFVNRHRKRDRRFLVESLEQRMMLDAGLGEVLLATSLPNTEPFSTTSQQTTLSAEGESTQQLAPDLVAFAKALTAAGVKFFGAGWCPHCTAQKQFFDDGANYLPFIEVTNPDRTRNQVGIDNNITSYPTWVFPDGSRITGEQQPSVISSLSGIAIPNGNSPSFVPLTDVTVAAGAPLWISLNGYDPNGDPLTYSAVSDNPSLIGTSIPTGNRSLRLTASTFGEMTFQLMDNLVPQATNHIVELVQGGYYDPTANNSVAVDTVLSSTDLKMIGTGAPVGSGNGFASSGPIADRFNPNLRFTSAGLLALRKASDNSDDSGDSQLMITGAPARSLDFQNSIIGVITEGQSNRKNVNETATTNNVPTRAIGLSNVQIFNDTENGVLRLSAPRGMTGQTTVTVSVSDGHGGTFQQQFSVTVVPDTIDSGPYLSDLSVPQNGMNAYGRFRLASQDVEGDAVSYFATLQGASGAQLDVDAQTGVVTVTPADNFQGTVQVLVGVKAANGVVNDTLGLQDTQLVTMSFQSSVYPWRNTSNPLDSQCDGIVAPGDALAIINILNAPGYQQTNGTLPTQRQSDQKSMAFCDVNGDGFVAPNDALLVIDYINHPKSGEGEGGSLTSNPTVASESFDAAALSLLYGDAEWLTSLNPTQKQNRTVVVI